MKKLILFITLVVLFGCRTRTVIQYQPYPVPERHDSIVEKIVHDTVSSYPVQQQQVTGTRKSHLETDLAFSDAAIDSSGLLKHSISNKGIIPARIIIEKTTVHDSIPYAVKGDPYPVEVIKIKYRHDIIWWIGLTVMVLSALYIFFTLKKKAK